MAMIEHPEIVDRQLVGDTRAVRQHLAGGVRPGVAEMNPDLHGGEPHPRATVRDILSVGY
jgi:hypothetical protein